MQTTILSWVQNSSFRLFYQYFCLNEVYLPYDPSCRSVGQLVGHNFLKRRRVTRQCSYRSTFYSSGHLFSLCPQNIKCKEICMLIFAHIRIGSFLINPVCHYFVDFPLTKNLLFLKYDPMNPMRSLLLEV